MPAVPDLGAKAYDRLALAILKDVLKREPTKAEWDAMTEERKRRAKVATLAKVRDYGEQ